MARRQHFLKPNDRLSSIQHALWFDTETDPVEVDPLTVTHRLRFGTAAYRRRLKGGVWSAPQWLHFTSPAAFWEWVQDHTAHKRRLHLYCHNTSFDLPVLGAFDQLPRLGWALHRAVIDAPPTILDYRKGQASLRILDTLNVWRMPLAKIGEWLGLPKLPMPDSGAPGPEWDRYCQRDVEIIMEACLHWWELLRAWDAGGVAPTLAGQAWRWYRHRGMRHKILVEDRPRTLALARESYHGGRVECFRLGRIPGPLWLLDVNSMFPAVMADESYPAVLRHDRRRSTVAELERELQDQCVVARVELETETPAYAVLRDGKLIHPVGRFVATLTTPDLRAALAEGAIRHVDHLVSYEAQPLFREWVLELWERRLRAIESGNIVESRMLKLVSNSLYGKFGQRGGRWVTDYQTADRRSLHWIHQDAETGETWRMRMLGGLVQRREDEPESAESCPAIAAHVTAYARRRLWDLILQAGRSHVYYCDTDSLLVDATGRRRLRRSIDPTRLGALKVEGRYREARLWGPKDYQLDGTAKHKGISSRAIWVAPNVAVQEQWEGLRGMVRRGDLAHPQTRAVKKVLARRYTKGTPLADGSVAPLRLSETLRVGPDRIVHPQERPRLGRHGALRRIRRLD